jgi:hypothetical protein
MSEALTLSPEIKNFVLLPIVLVTFLVNLGRTYVQQLIASQKVQDKEKASYVQTLTRSRRTRQNGHFIRPEAFSSRQSFFSAKKVGVLCNSDIPGAVNPMMQQGGAPGGGAMDMMKNQMTFMVPNMVMMAGMSYFFSGFVIAKVPFPLTPRFKMMLQQGINLQSLDPSYVSALSWYFLVMFGIRGVMGLFLGKKHVVLWGGGWRGKNLGGGPMCCCLCCSCSPSKPVLSLFSCLLFHCIRWFR